MNTRLFSSFFFAEHSLVVLFFVVLAYVLSVPDYLFGIFLSVEILFAILLTLAVSQIMKIIIRKRRPKEMSFVPLDRYSFPSKHAAVAMAIATAILLGNKYLGMVAVAIAIFAGYGRVEARVHDYRDILGGYLVGIVVTLLLLSSDTALLIYFSTLSSR